MLWVSVIVSMASMLLGTYASFFIDSAPAPTIILIMTALFMSDVRAYGSKYGNLIRECFWLIVTTEEWT